MSPTHRSCADRLGKLMIYRENPEKYPSLAKNPPNYTTADIEQLQVALGTFIFIMLGINNDKSIHTLPLHPSISYLSISSK
jgi:hypothetical protein